MEKPRVVSTQHYNWDYAGKSYMFVVLQHDGGNFEVSFETRTYSGEWVSIFRRSFLPSGLPSFECLVEIAMRYFAEMFGIEYEEKK